MKKIIISFIAFWIFCPSFAQNVGINSTGAAPVSSAALDIDMANKGLLIPRVALTTRTAFAPVTGTATSSLMVYNTATSGTSPNNVTPGYYYWDQTTWVRVLNSGSAWESQGNSGTNASTNFIGTTDNIDFVTRVNNTESMRVFAANGNVGIGITAVSATDRLTVKGGNFLIVDASNQGGFIQGFDPNHSIYFREGAANQINYYEYGGSTTAGAGHRFLTGGLRTAQTLKFQIADNAVYSSVPVGIGTTTPTSKLDVLGSHTGAAVGTGGNSDGPSQLIVGAGSNGSTRQNDWPNGWWGGISTNDICGTSIFMSGYITRSDSRLKKDITSMDNGLITSYMRLRPVTYYMKDDSPEMAGLQYGFIAQEVKEIFPSLVTSSIDPNGVIGMNYQGLIAPTVYIVQEQQKQIDELKKEVAELKEMMIQLMMNQK